MNKYLQLLLQQESTVIIPGFGAIVIANEQTGDLLFNEYLKFNDGKLVEFIVEQSNMDEQEALNFIAKYVREINTQLDKGESYDMFGFGSFSKNKDGKVVFVSWDKIKDKGPAEVQNIIEEEELIQKEEKKAASKEEKKKEPKKKEKSEKPDKSDKKEESKNAKEKKENSYIPPVTDNIEKVEIPETKKEETPKEEIKAAPQKEEREVKVKVATQKKVVAVPPKKKNRWGLIIILLLIVGIGTILSIKFEEIKNYISSSQDNSEETVLPAKEETDELKEEGQESEAINTSKEDSLNQLKNDSLEMSLAESEDMEAQETIEEETPAEEETSIEETTVSTGNKGGKYKMITGNFEKLENAERMVERLKKLGYNAEIIGVYYGLHRVAMSRYDDYQEAISHIPEAKEIVSGAYVSPE